jgi:hypothetical protein
MDPNNRMTFLRESLKVALRYILPGINTWSGTSESYHAINLESYLPNWLLHEQPGASLLGFIWPFDPDFDVVCWSRRCSTWAWGSAGIFPSRLWTITSTEEFKWLLADYWVSESGSLLLIKIGGIIALFLFLHCLIAMMIGRLLSTAPRLSLMFLRLLYRVRWWLALAFVQHWIRAYLAGWPLPFSGETFFALIAYLFSNVIYAISADIWTKVMELVFSAPEDSGKSTNYQETSDLDSAAEHDTSSSKYVSTADSAAGTSKTSNDGTEVSHSNKAALNPKEGLYQHDIHASKPPPAASPTVQCLPQP